MAAVTIPALRSLRAKFLLVVVGGVVVPLGLVGLWLTRTAARSGESLLETKLDSALTQTVSEAGMRWVQLRADLLDLGDDSVVQRVLISRMGSPGRGKSPARPDTLVFAATHSTADLAGSLLGTVTLTDGAGEPTSIIAIPRDPAKATESWRFPSPGDGAEGIAVDIPVYRRAGVDVIGHVKARVTLESLVPKSAGGLSGLGVILQVIDRSTGLSVNSLPFDPPLPGQRKFQLAGDTWLVRRRTLEEPALSIAAMSPLNAYTLPFEAAARKGSFAIFGVVIAALAFAVVSTRRLTRALEELASATHAVATGDLNRRVSEAGDDEVGRVGRAFNAMTESLHTMIRQLSQRQALAAVGEFAASLAHEIRNPLTSIRIDLQRVEEKLPDESVLRVQLGRALREVQRLDRTVSGALRIARSGSIASDIVDLRVPLGRAIEVAAPAFQQSGSLLADFDRGATPFPISGDDAALEQLFLNILLNAAQALTERGKAGVSIGADGVNVTVDVWDSGSGIPAHQLASVFDAFYTTRKDGTGLGLSVARQIVIAHGGTIDIDSAVDSGTTVSIAFPLAKAVLSKA